MLAAVKRMFNHSDKTVRRHQKTVALVNGLDLEFQTLTDEELAGKTALYKDRVASGETLEQLLPEAFATVREAARRVLGKRHFDVQLIGGMVLHEGNVSEMRTGEGKTLVATLPTYLNALTGRGVHVITVNDYLARVGKEEMGRIYQFLGLSTGLIVHGMDAAERRAAYACDITYGTNNEFGFDYLRDNMAISPSDLVQRDLHFAIVDEADSILIDEARTPLIISGPSDKPAELYHVFATLSGSLEKGTAYTVEEKEKRIAVTDEGITSVEKALGVENLVDPENANLFHYLLNALKAKELFHCDRDYVVRDGQVVIVDEFTGRLMFGRRWSNGQHQAIEAKEGVNIERESITLATITLQNFFRMYRKLSGMTGTASTEETEFRHIYNMDVITIPTNRPTIRRDGADVVFKSADGKYRAVAAEVEARHATGQPVLVGTVSIAQSEKLSALLQQRGVPHQVLNAKYHEQEAEIVAQAGRYGAVTIATNMAGRGTDILLGGNAEFMARQEMRSVGYTDDLLAIATEGHLSDNPENRHYQLQYRELAAKHKQETDQDAERVRAAGGLCVIGTERHEARRIDNQLRGRSGRQGDPGLSMFYVAMDDDLMRLFGGDRAARLLETLGFRDDQPIDHPLITRTIANAQKKVESAHFDARKQVLQYDEVLNEQRTMIYSQRRRMVMDEDIQEMLWFAMQQVAVKAVAELLPNGTYMDEVDLDPLFTRIRNLGLPTDIFLPDEVRHCKKPDEFAAKLAQRMQVHYHAWQESRFEPNNLRQMERLLFLQMIDRGWVDHLSAMDGLREGIGLRAYGQKDPAMEYKFEAMTLFNDMVNQVQEELVCGVFRLNPEPSLAAPVLEMTV